MTISTERIAAAVRQVLEASARGEDDPPLLSAGQILERLPEGLRTALLAEYEAPRGTAVFFTAELRVAQVARSLDEVERSGMLEARGDRCVGCAIPGPCLGRGEYRVDSRRPGRPSAAPGFNSEASPRRRCVEDSDSPGEP